METNDLSTTNEIWLHGQFWGFLLVKVDSRKGRIEFPVYRESPNFHFGAFGDFPIVPPNAEIIALARSAVGTSSLGYFVWNVEEGAELLERSESEGPLRRQRYFRRAHLPTNPLNWPTVFVSPSIGTGFDMVMATIDPLRGDKGSEAEKLSQLGAVSNLCDFLYYYSPTHPQSLKDVLEKFGFKPIEPPPPDDEEEERKN